jgi:hypothetical protein
LQSGFILQHKEKAMQKSFLYSLVFSLFTYTMFQLSCCEKSTEPIGRKNYPDTTSHDFSWKVDTIGLFSSALLDVAAIDEQNVWAVGEVYTPGPDTVWGTEKTRNNAVKWNGEHFEYHQILVNSYDGPPSIHRLRVALAFSKNNIWFLSDPGSYVHWDGSNWNSAWIAERKGTPYAAWGSSSNDIYIVGSNGSITHYNGSKFTLMDSGTEKLLHDVTGYVDPKTGRSHVWAAGELVLLYYNGQDWETVWDEENPLFPDEYNHPCALYAPNHKQLIIAAYYPINIRGYSVNTRNVSQYTQLFSVPNFATKMQGLSVNDIFISGSWNRIAHYNGVNAVEYPEMDFTGTSTGLSCIDGNVYYVGYSSSQFGYFIHGIKN